MKCTLCGKILRGGQDELSLHQITCPAIGDENFQMEAPIMKSVCFRWRKKCLRLAPKIIHLLLSDVEKQIELGCVGDDVYESKMAVQIQTGWYQGHLAMKGEIYQINEVNVNKDGYVEIAMENDNSLVKVSEESGDQEKLIPKQGEVESVHVNYELNKELTIYLRK